MQEKITIERLAYGDAGIGHAANGKTVFVNGTCPGDVVLADLARDKGSYFEADLLEVAETSPHRVALTCPFADTCGGCGWQHIAYETQLEAKRENVVSQACPHRRIRRRACRRSGGRLHAFQTPIRIPQQVGI